MAMLKILSRILKTGIVTESLPEAPPSPDIPSRSLTAVQEDVRKMLGRALCIRHVDAGSCNGCELEIVALNNPYYNLEGAGIRFVASPRHADLLLVTGPVSVNMEEALRRTYDAVPNPKLVVAVGDCGACGGLFGTSYASRGAIANVIPVNLTIAGCPPSPRAILCGILDLVGVLRDRHS
jgi:Ni,Fe-hydrogenase III small subunit